MIKRIRKRPINLEWPIFQGKVALKLDSIAKGMPPHSIGADAVRKIFAVTGETCNPALWALHELDILYAVEFANPESNWVFHPPHSVVYPDPFEKIISSICLPEYYPSPSVVAKRSKLIAEAALRPQVKSVEDAKRVGRIAKGKAFKVPRPAASVSDLRSQCRRTLRADFNELARTGDMAYYRESVRTRSLVWQHVTRHPALPSSPPHDLAGLSVLNARQFYNSRTSYQEGDELTPAKPRKKGRPAYSETDVIFGILDSHGALDQYPCFTGKTKKQLRNEVSRLIRVLGLTPMTVHFK